VLTYPFMVGIQLVSARIGRVTGRGLAANIRRAYSPWLLYAIVALLLVANVINIAADIAAMGEALRLVTGIGSQHMYSLASASCACRCRCSCPTAPMCAT
jgi:Mn2+/Fe2+ NRAMP family transporter